MSDGNFSAFYLKNSSAEKVKLFMEDLFPSKNYGNGKFNYEIHVHQASGTVAILCTDDSDNNYIAEVLTKRLRTFVVLIDFYDSAGVFSFRYFKGGKLIRSIRYSYEEGVVKTKGEEQEFEEGLYRVKYFPEYPMYRFNSSDFITLANNLDLVTYYWATDQDFKKIFESPK